MGPGQSIERRQADDRGSDGKILTRVPDSMQREAQRSVAVHR
jgi:hypothetical protein